jgi:outer membrane lipopolysaccharide assembly protein LptE/RlpB
MQTYRLVIEADGRVTIPNAQPGQTVTVQVEPLFDSAPLTLATAETSEERAAVIKRLQGIAGQLHEELSEHQPLTTDDLYGEDGLPT